MPCVLIASALAVLLNLFVAGGLEFYDLLFQVICFVLFGALVTVLFLGHAVMTLIGAPERRVRRNVLPTLAAICGLVIGAGLVALVVLLVSPQ